MVSFKPELLCGLGWLSLHPFYWQQPIKSFATSNATLVLGSLQMTHGGSVYPCNLSSEMGYCLYSDASSQRRRSFRGQRFAVSFGKLHNGEQHNASSTQDVPLFVPGGIIIEDWGSIYQGDGEEKYYNRKSASRHPYPVGYVAKKVYKGSVFRQTIQAGPDGPIFMVQIGEACFSADSLNRAWALASDYFQPGSEHRIHAHRHYGFENKDVLERLSRMQEEHAEKDISQIHALLKSRTLQRSTEQVSKQKKGKLNKHSENSESNGMAVKEEQKSSRPLTRVKKIAINEGPFGDTASNDGFDKLDKSFKMQPLTYIPNNDLFKKMVRLRSKLLTETISEKDDIVGLLQDFKGFMRPQAGRSISTSLQTNSGVNSLSSYSDNSGSKGIFARWALSEPRGLCNESGSLSTDARKLIAADKKVCSQEEEESVVSPRQYKHLTMKNLLPESWDKNGEVHDDADVALISNEQSDAAPCRSRMSSLRESALFKSSARGAQSSYALDELLQYWRKTDMLPGETMLPTDNGISLHSDSNKAEVDKETQDAEEVSAFNEEASVIERIQGFVANQKFEEAVSLFKKHNLTAEHLSKAFFPFELDDWQTLALQHLNGGDSVLVCAPCGAGKSVIATLCLYESVLKDKRAIFVTPFVGLAYQHFLTFQETFGESRVGGAWEATRVQMHAKILVVTLEFFVKELRDQIGLETSKKTIPLEGLNIVVLDKFFVAIDGGLGSFWEETMMLMDSQIKLLALSLPTTNGGDLVSWISHIHRPCKLVQCESEPVPKRYFFFDSTGLHELPNLKPSVLNGSLKSSLSNSEIIARENPKNTTSNVHPGLGSIAITLQERSMLPAVVFFHDPEECITATRDVMKAISIGLSSKGDTEIIEKRLNKLLEATPEYLSLLEEDQEGLRHGIVAHHELQVPFWKQFVDALIQDGLVQLVLTTQHFFCHREKFFRTTIVSLKPKANQDEEHFIRKISQQQGLAGRRGIEEYGNVVFLGSQTSAIERIELLSRSWIRFSSYFKPSYSLLVNLLAKFDSVKVKEVIERSFSSFMVKNMAEKELGHENQPKLESAAVFTQVDVRLKKDVEKRGSYLLSGVMLAIAPGPHERLYMILCADNKFRLVPAGALESIYSEEPPLDLAHQLATGITLKPPSLPKRRRWLPDLVGYESYVANGTPESAQLVEVLQQTFIKSCANAEKEEMREGACWEEAQKKISVLERAGALSQQKPANEIKLGPLATLIAGLHYLENELWVSMVLTSSFTKPLTPPELASICSTLVFRTENFEILKEDKFKLSYKVPKRIQETLSKMEALREHVASMEGSPTDSLSFDITPAAIVHAWIRGKPWIQNFRFDSVNDGATASILQNTLRLLQQIDMTCTESSRKGQDLDGFLGLASISRRAAFLIKRYLTREDLSSYIK